MPLSDLRFKAQAPNFSQLEFRAALAMFATGVTIVTARTAELFPTSIGANPQLSVYGVVNRLAQDLVKRLTGSMVKLA